MTANDIRALRLNALTSVALTALIETIKTAQADKHYRGGDNERTARALSRFRQRRGGPANLPTVSPASRSMASHCKRCTMKAAPQIPLMHKAEVHATSTLRI